MVKKYSCIFLALCYKTFFINVQDCKLNILNWTSFTNCDYLILSENFFRIVLNAMRKFVLSSG